MDNKGFMDLVQRKLKASRGGDLPESGQGATYDNPNSNYDWKAKETTFGICSRIHEGTSHIAWGIEIVIPFILSVEQVTLEYFFQKGVRRGYVSIRDHMRNDKGYKLASTDLETVTDILKGNQIQLYTPLRMLIVPDLKGKKLEEALPILFNTFYERK